MSKEEKENKKQTMNETLENTENNNFQVDTGLWALLIFALMNFNNPPSKVVNIYLGDDK